MAQGPSMTRLRWGGCANEVTVRALSHFHCGTKATRG